MSKQTIKFARARLDRYDHKRVYSYTYDGDWNAARRAGVYGGKRG